MDQIFYGEHKCQGIKASGEKCNNGAYFLFDGKILCGVHSKKYHQRVKLPINKDPMKTQQQRMADTETERVKNGKGKVIVTKLRMMKCPEYPRGFVNVYPNYKHGGRIDGWGLPELSPKNLGPVEHGMPNLPPAKTIENYHQFAKVFKFEENKSEKELLKIRSDGYLDDIPHRHKYEKKFLKQFEKSQQQTVCSIYYDQKGIAHSYKYVDCRYFYCHWYEKLVKKTKDFKFLVEKMNKGYNLNIVGYDGYCVDELDLMDCYLDTSKPFGHELVLYSMLTVDEPKKYPWNVYYQSHKNIYSGVIEN